jgi:transcriptional regulator with XRE-family HTH domain
MTFGEKLKAIRISRQMSQPVLAKRSRVSQASISNYEDGNGSPSWDKLQRIAAALKVSCVDLTDDDTPTPKKK